MPTIEISKKDMEKMLGKKLPSSAAELNDIFQYIGGEVESLSGDAVQLEIKCRNRPDLWCAEGIARELKGALGIETGLRDYKTKSSKRTLHVNKNINKIRPFIAAAVIKNVKITEELLIQMIQMQEKVCMSYGRKRKRAAMGVYDFDKVEGDIYYRAADPKKTKFTPLEMDKELNLIKILSKHPKGREYGHLLEDFKKYPLVADSKDNVLSMPPIINSNYSGKVTEKTKNLFIEVTGDDWDVVHTSLLIAVTALAERGGKIRTVKVKYPSKTVTTPDFSTETWQIGVIETNARLGTNFDAKQVAALLQKARYGTKIKKKGGFKFIYSEVPAYRADIMHDVDLIEDIAIMHGYSEFEPKDLDVATVGKLSKDTEFARKVRKLMLGYGGQEVQTFTLTNGSILTSKINDDRKVLKVENPMSENYEYLRPEIWPLLIDFLSKNTNRSYPQSVFEVGDVIAPNSSAENKSDTKKHLAFALAKKDADFTYAKQVMTSLLADLGLDCRCKELDSDSFIPGRAAKVYVGRYKVGLIGEVHPAVLNNFGIGMPICVFELNLEKLNR